MQLSTELSFIGNKAYDAVQHQYVPFATESDAMMASLVLTHQIALPILDIVFSIFKNPRFDVNQITFRDVDDVLEQAEENRLLRRRSAVTQKQFVATRRNSGYSGGNIPHFIIEEVADIFAAEREKVLHTYRDAHLSILMDSRRRGLDRDLKTMSLVHRSWTFTAQKSLGRIFFAKNPSAPVMRNALQTPVFGPWTREILFYYYRADDSLYPEQTFRLMERFLYRSENVRSLCIGADGDGIQHWVDTVVGRLQNFHRLEELRLRSTKKALTLLDPLIDVFAGLTHLRHLELGNYRVQKYVQGDASGGVRVPPSLRSMSLVMRTLTSLKQLASLFVFDDDAFLESLSIIPDSHYINVQLLQSERLNVILRRLQRLHLAGSENQARWIIPQCPALRELTLDLQLVTSRDLLEILPQSLEILQINFECTRQAPAVEQEWAFWDDAFYNFLSTRRCPNLLQLTVEPLWCLMGKLKLYAMDRDISGGARCKLTRAQSYCRSHGIDLQLGGFAFPPLNKKTNHL